MTAGDRPHKEDVAAFLDGETRQVWVRDRHTGDPVFIEQGSAALMRNRARHGEIGCIVPGCAAAISVRGGTKRDAYFHLTKVDHPGGSETFNHQQGKAMLAAWARVVTGSGTVVREEQSVKNSALSVHRRPDVLVTNPDQSRVALEVEYKDYSVADWRRKQDDLDRLGVSTNWLFGHTKIRTHGRGDYYPAYVRIPALMSALASGQGPVLVVNPSTRQIGTILGNAHRTRWLQPGAQDGYLFLDDLDACRYDPSQGIVTPSADAVAAAEREKAEATRAEAARQREVIERAHWARTAAAESSPLVSDTWTRFYAKCWDRWLQSPERAAVDRVWGDRPPVWLTFASAEMWGVHAVGLHWHTALYERVIAPHPDGGGTYEFWGLFRHLNAAGIPVSNDPKKRAAAMRTWLEIVEQAGLVRLDRDPVNRFIVAIHVLHNWETAPAEARHFGDLPLDPSGKPSRRPGKNPAAGVMALCPPEVAQELSARRISVGRVMRAAGVTSPLTVETVRRWKTGREPVPVWAAQFLPQRGQVTRASSPDSAVETGPKAYWCDACQQPLPEDRDLWDAHLGHPVRRQV